MRIVDINANPIKGCFIFGCDGFEVSCSTIANPPEVLVWRLAHRKDGAMYRATCVADAVRWCRENQDRV